MQRNPDCHHHAKCEQMALTNLAFADDILLFCRGDAGSVDILMTAFRNFSLSTGLIFNPSKCNIFFGSVEVTERNKIRTRVGFAEGSFPIRYLGVPLSSKKLSLQHYLPLIAKITGRIHHWSTKLLSYAGRIQLVNSIICSITQYWMHNFPLPKCVLRKIDTICRTFVWTGRNDASHKSYVAWKNMCKPRKQGGLGIKNLTVWNQVALLKCLWNISNKSDSLWVKWIHKVYLKNCDVMEVSVGTSWTWTIRNILNLRSKVTQIQLLWDQMLLLQKFSMKAVYNVLIDDLSRSTWSKLLLHNHARPKAKFTA